MNSMFVETTLRPSFGIGCTLMWSRSISVQEQGHAVGRLRAGVARRRPGDQQQPVGLLGAGDEDLAAVDLVATRHLLGERRDARGVGACVRLGDTERHLQLALAAFGRKRRFCSSLPCLTIGSSPNSATCTMVPALSAPPLPVTSSISRAASWTPAPPPPYSSGCRCRSSRRPPSCRRSPTANSWSMSCRIQYSSVNPDIVLRTDVRISRSSSALSMSTTCRSHHRFLLMVIMVSARGEIASGHVNYVEDARLWTSLTPPTGDDRPVRTAACPATATSPFLRRRPRSRRPCCRSSRRRSDEPPGARSRRPNRVDRSGS